MIRTVRCEDARATHRLGRVLGQIAEPGTALGLDGRLGAGKTAFAKGVGEGLGVQTRVTSPTFILLALHEGRLPLFHADVYRLGDESELDALGFEDAVDGVLLVEWASRFPDALPHDHLAVEILIDEDARDVRIHAHGARSVSTLVRWLAAWEASDG